MWRRARFCSVPVYASFLARNGGLLTHWQLLIARDGVPSVVRDAVFARRDAHDTSATENR
jgi:hypothetical protein